MAFRVDDAGSASFVIPAFQLMPSESRREAKRSLERLLLPDTSLGMYNTAVDEALSFDSIYIRSSGPLES